MTLLKPSSPALLDTPVEKFDGSIFARYSLSPYAPIITSVDPPACGIQNVRGFDASGFQCKQRVPSKS
jgi:hypothetical protein